MEIWKASNCMVGYEVSDRGNVRHARRKNNLTPTSNGNGYYIVGRKINGKKKNYYVHRLVADAFCEKAINDEEVNHLDFNRGNNQADNLEWCSRLDNMHYSIAGGRIVFTEEKKERLDKARVLANQLARKAVAIIDNQNNITTIFDSLTAASKALGVSIASVSRATKGRENSCRGIKLIRI